MQFLCPRDPLRGSAWSRYKNSSCFCVFAVRGRILSGDRRGRRTKAQGFFAISDLPARPFCGARGSAWSRCKNSKIVCVFCGARMKSLRGSAWSRCKNSRPFQFSDLPDPSDPLRGSAWPRCKNLFFAILAAPARGIGAVEVQLEVFCDF